MLLISPKMGVIREQKKFLGFSGAERKKTWIDAGSKDSLCVAEDNAVITGSQQEELITRIEMSVVRDSIYMWPPCGLAPRLRSWSGGQVRAIAEYVLSPGRSRG